MVREAGVEWKRHGWFCGLGLYTRQEEVEQWCAVVEWTEGEKDVSVDLRMPQCNVIPVQPSNWSSEGRRHTDPATPLVEVEQE
ncbi:hypothetical protein Pmani_034180 [Petrolisthes manimaculis]|uniref:Uncharacterized protein n=1 Tax=Petrolisthes manimaculis TaxID=1843537 RepID=A0AAE1NN21_9EUCA|nr:hypothetical protein Pmani_034180 [Petrolisthes manimaculis]